MVELRVKYGGKMEKDISTCTQTSPCAPWAWDKINSSGASYVNSYEKCSKLCLANPKCNSCVRSNYGTIWRATTLKKDEYIKCK